MRLVWMGCVVGLLGVAGCGSRPGGPEAVRACEQAVEGDYRARFGGEGGMAFAPHQTTYSTIGQAWNVRLSYATTEAPGGIFHYRCRVKRSTGKLTLKLPVGLPTKLADDPTRAAMVAAEAAVAKAQAAADVEQMKAIAAAEKAIATSTRAARGRGMTDADVNRLTTYAVAIGRAYGCGINASAEGGRVGDWLLTRVKRGSREESDYSTIFMAGVIQARDAQRAGRSPDSCDEVRRSFALYRWP